MDRKHRFLFQRFGLTLIALVVLAMLVMVSGCAKDADLPGYPTNKTVTTAYGDVRGTTISEAWVWKGVPYAKAPVGDLRWKAPVDPDPWTGVRDASTACSECVQQVYDAHWFSQNAFIGSEDCLYLDIYAPKSWQGNLPVYFYIHGGSNNFGSAKQYSGAALAKRGNMIVVYVQYRLNAFGFLTHPSLRTNGDDLDDSGNYGTLDIMKALAWVQANIAAFGGDPTKVVIGGQSAGAHNVVSLLLSPQAANFRGAFVQSAAMDPSTVAAADARTNTTIDGLLIRGGFAADAGAAAALRATLTDEQIARFLRGQPAELVARCRRDGTGADGSGSMANHSVIRDGVVIRDATWTEAIAAGNYHKIPVVFGTTRYEYKNFAPLYGTYVKLLTGNQVPSGANSWYQLWNTIGVLEPAMTADDVLPLQRDKDIYETINALKSKQWRMTTGVDNVTRALKANDPANPVYAYQFDWVGGSDPALANFAAYFGAGHSMDIPFFQGVATDSWNVSFTATNKPGRDALQAAMMDYLIAFVQTLNPNPAGSSLPVWPQWDNTAGVDKIIHFNADLNNYLITTESAEIIAADLAAEIAAAKATYTEAAGAFALFGM